MGPAGLRVQVDEGDSRMNAKIRAAQLQKVPYMLVVGDREAAAGTVAVRTRAGEQLSGVDSQAFAARVRERVAAKSLEV